MLFSALLYNIFRRAAFPDKPEAHEDKHKVRGINRAIDSILNEDERLLFDSHLWHMFFDTQGEPHAGDINGAESQALLNEHHQEIGVRRLDRIRVERTRAFARFLKQEITDAVELLGSTPTAFS